MQNHIGTIDSKEQPRISQSDRLLFCLFLALAFHGMLFFGVGFKLPDLNASSYEKTFSVVLAQFESDEKPENAQFISQANQEGGGDSEEIIAPSAKEMAEFNDPNEMALESQQQASQEQINETSTEVLIGNNDSSALLNPQQESQQNKNIPDAASLIDRSYQLTGLIANLDKEQVNQAHKGRKRTISASTHRSSDALYLDNWRRKVERVGNLNYPEKAKTENIYGNLTMKVAINRDGTINEVKIIKSSGSKVLDDAALRIIRLAAPFKPLAKEMSKDTDILQIIRVWQFQPDYSLETN
jgi:protein TonB